MLNFEEIKQILPHRYPFLLIDRVLEVTPGQFCRALKNVSGSDPVFQGHFPNRPILPGVYIIEAMAQTGGIVVFSHYGKKAENAMAFFGGIEKARFKRPVVPGDQLILETTLKAHRKNLWIFNSKALVDDQLAAQAEIKMMLQENFEA